MGALGVALLVGCGGMPRPTEQLIATERAVSAAEEHDPESHPKAALHLKLAREQLEKARRFMDVDDHDRATWYLRRAESDAEVARVMAKTKFLREEAARALKEVERLRASFK